MDIFKKIDEMFEEEDINKKILEEIKEIKLSIKNLHNEKNVKNEKRTLNKQYYKFFYEFREKIKEKPREGIFPEFEIDGKVYAINKNGIMYEKPDKILSKKEAFEIYEKIFFNGYFVVEGK